MDYFATSLEEGNWERTCSMIFSLVSSCEELDVKASMKSVMFACVAGVTRLATEYCFVAPAVLLVPSFGSFVNREARGCPLL